MGVKSRADVSGRKKGPTTASPVALLKLLCGVGSQPQGVLGQEQCLASQCE